MPETTGPRERELLGQTVSYDIRYSDDATQPRIDVDIDGVRVILPADSDDDPGALLEQNAAWVIEKKQKYDEYREQVPDRSFEEGTSFPYLGEAHRIVIEQRPASDVLDGKLCLAQHHVEQTSVKRALETLYRRKARNHFENRAAQLADEMSVEYEQIEIRNQRTKWGSCSTNGTLGLNWRLMMAPPDVIKYIIIHELAHLREPNHTTDFWNIVAEYDPEYRAHAEWLDEHSTQLIFSNDDL